MPVFLSIYTMGKFVYFKLLLMFKDKLGADYFFQTVMEIFRSENILHT